MSEMSFNAESDYIVQKDDHEYPYYVYYVTGYGDNIIIGEPPRARSAKMAVILFLQRELDAVQANVE